MTVDAEPGDEKATPPGMIAITGLAVMVVGVVLLAWPKPTLLVFSQLAGWAMGVTGFLGALEVARTEPIRAWRLVRYIGIGLVGVALIIWPGPTILVATLLVGIWLITDGGSRILDTLWADSPRAEIIGNLLGIAELALGVLVIARPVGGVRAAAAFTGLGLIAHALGRFWDAFTTRRDRSGAPA